MVVGGVVADHGRIRVSAPLLAFDNAYQCPKTYQKRRTWMG